VTVTKEITRLEHSNVKLSLTVPKDDVRAEYDKLLQDYTKSIQLPGFRKGKVPRDVLVRKFGDALKGEALGRIVEKAVEQVFADDSPENALAREDKPLPYSTPKIEDEEALKLDFDGDLKFSVIYDVLPKVAVGQWQGLEIEVPDVAIEDEDINRELESLRERNAIVMDKEEGEGAAQGDVVTVNYCELGESGEVEPNTERQDFVFTIGTGLNIYKFDDDIVGMKKGEEKVIEKTFPEDFDDKDLAGKAKKIRVELTALKVKKLPDLDDDLAQDVDEKYATLDDLKAGIRERLDKELDGRLRNYKINKILEKVMETTPVEIPESMTNLELDSRWRATARRFGTDADGLYRMMGNAPDGVQGILDSWKPDANRALHSRLIVETLMEDLKLEASDEEVEKEIETQAEASGSPVEDFKKYYEQGQMRDYLKEDIKERKLHEKMFAENTIKPGEKMKYMEFVGNNG
jgi:trigger factor